MLDLTAAAAAQHDRALRLEGGRERFAALAACCRPTALRRAASGLLARLRAGQLGPGYVAPGYDRPAACC